MRPHLRCGAIDEPPENAEPRREGPFYRGRVVIEAGATRDALVSGLSQRTERQRTVVDRASEDPDVIEAPRERHDADRADPPVGRLETDQAAVRGRPQHRTYRLRPEGQR